MTEINTEKEINLLDILAHTYLFFHRKWKLFFTIIILTLGFGLYRELHNNEQKVQFEANIKIYSTFIENDVIDKAAQKIYLGQSDNHAFLMKSGFSAPVSSQIIEIRNAAGISKDDSAVYIKIIAKNSSAIEEASTQLIQILSNEPEIKARIEKINSFKKSNLATINAKIKELESIKSTESSNYTKSDLGSKNIEYLFLLDKKLFTELSQNSNPLKQKISNYQKINTRPSIKLIIFKNLFLGFALASIIVFILNTITRAKARALEMEKEKQSSK